MKFGVALGGGGVRGLAHIPALEAIDEFGIKPVMLAGTSMGAIIGAMYASGLSGKEIRAIIDRHTIAKGKPLSNIYRKMENLIRWLSAVRPTRTRSGLLKADGFLHYLLQEIHVDTFEELKIPLQVVATDFYRGEAVVLSSGPLLPALQASMSIPGIFAHVEYDGKILVDGGLVNNLPYDLLVDRCDVSIAIDVAPSRDTENTKPPQMIDAILGMFDILVDKVTEAKLAEQAPTIYIRPKFVGIRTLEFDKAESVFRQAAPEIQVLRTKLGSIKESI